MTPLTPAAVMDEQWFSDLRRRLRFESSDDDAPSTILQTMADADEVITILIAERDAARAERDEARLSNTVTENHTIQQLTAALTEARRVLRDVLPVDCEHVHHPKRDQHPSDQACPVLQRAAAVIAQEEPR